MKLKITMPILQVLFCLLMLLASWYFEYFVKLTPCALCAVQRIIVISLLTISICHLFWKHNFFNIVSILFCIVGMLLAFRHAWMQQHPELFKNAACLPDISYMWKAFPVSEIITSLLKQGGAECVKIKWSLLGISMPGWLAVSYIVLLAIYICSIRSKN